LWSSLYFWRESLAEEEPTTLAATTIDIGPISCYECLQARGRAPVRNSCQRLARTSEWERWTDVRSVALRNMKKHLNQILRHVLTRSLSKNTIIFTCKGESRKTVMLFCYLSHHSVLIFLLEILLVLCSSNDNNRNIELCLLFQFLFV
jgi:hypothetical protein